MRLSLRNFRWLPVCPVSVKPFFSSTDIACVEEYRLGINNGFSDHGIFDSLEQTFRVFISKIKRNGIP